MWGNKKPDAPQAGQPDAGNFQLNQPPKPSPATWEDKPAMSTDAMRPLGATADRAMARLGASLHVKGEISGSDDLLIDGVLDVLPRCDGASGHPGPMTDLGQQIADQLDAQGQKVALLALFVLVIVHGVRIAVQSRSLAGLD